jgi:signal transduction histidine kinase
MTSTAKYSLEFFLSERRSALNLVVHEEPVEVLRNPDRLSQLLSYMKQAFGGFIDLGLIGEDGQHLAYAGPYDLEGINYAGEDWFHEVWSRGNYTSDVFLGRRDVPHFVIAVRHDTAERGSYVLRATIDTKAIERRILRMERGQPFVDAFLVNREGILQTPSGLYGDVLQRCPLPLPRNDRAVEVLESFDERGAPLIAGMAQIEDSPFAVMLVSRPTELGASWLSLRRNLLAFLAISVSLILVVVVWGSTSIINRIRESDLKRTALRRRMEHTNKLAAIGRLASGVAHEINNPLAIINEKTGLAKDLLTFSTEPPPKEKLLDLFESVLYSVERCKRVTSRLLGFAKHLDLQHQWIDVRLLLREVLGFLEREASYRNLNIIFDLPQDLPLLFSDRGQLQQVFLNLLNNAFAAVKDKGEIHITAQELKSHELAVSIRDDGVGIPDEDLQHIFDPFFTTKGAKGTGLGLSITYGIVDKLGGRIEVESAVEEGTQFTVVLPAGM